jgi:hypothetical protein
MAGAVPLRCSDEPAQRSRDRHLPPPPEIYRHRQMSQPSTRTPLAAERPAAPAPFPRRAVRRTPLPQPPAPEWSAALAPSQRRAAEARATAARRRSAQEWLRNLSAR